MRVEAGEFTRVYDASAGESERWYINDHTFFRDRGGTWHLIGITHAEPAAPHDEKHLAHATAPSLHGPWTKRDFALSVEPALGESLLWAPHVITHDDRYWMFVCAGGADMSAYRIHLATSDDAITWTRHDANPLVVDGYEARDPMVLRVGARWVLYYTATSEPTGGHHIVAAVESSDLVHWNGRRVVYTDAAAGTFGGPTESPFVVNRNDHFFLFIGPDWKTLMESFERDGRYDLAAYRRTRVIESDDPFHFDTVDHVGSIDAHAAEVVVDEAGQTWVSHCGWAQGGVYLAPLRWSTAS